MRKLHIALNISQLNEEPVSNEVAMFNAMRRAARGALPDGAIAAFRTVRHASLFPFEPELFFIRRYLRRDALAVDVGANVGLYTRVMARHAKAVLAFEPHPDCARHLRRTSPLNATVIEYALSEHAGGAILRAPVTGGVEHHGLASLAEAGVGDRSYPVATCALDSVAATNRLPVSFIKIDVEGHELPVLRGARGLISEHRPVLMVEIEYRHSPCVRDTFDFLGLLGYRAHLLEGKRLAPTSADLLRSTQATNPRANNVIFLPVADGLKAA